MPGVTQARRACSSAASSPLSISPSALRIEAGAPAGSGPVAIEAVFARRGEVATSQRKEYTRSEGRIRVEAFELHVVEHPLEGAPSAVVIRAMISSSDTARRVTPRLAASSAAS